MDAFPMTQAPTPRFNQRPDPPAVGTPDYDRWKQESALAWPGGTLTATYGNLAQTFALNTIENACAAQTVSVSRAGGSRVNRIGGPATSVKATSFSLRRYPKKNAGNAAAGAAILIRTEVGEYTARLTGSIQDFVAYLCGNGSRMFGSIYVHSANGAKYGPFNPIQLS